MKSSSITLVVVISALALPQSAYANPENVPMTTADAPKERFHDRNQQAGVLLTQPATINTTWSNFIGQTNNSKHTAESISLVRERGCQNINPLEFIKNPDAFFKQCQKPTNTQSSEPIEYLKVPKLDSGISVTVTKF
ncbi:hypothetical protein [Nostoc sp.]|uniref:hypothetical protein n=1 Tax=Nostoc sp. TaxID=1180 RepID=UPI002FF7B9E6